MTADPPFRSPDPDAVRAAVVADGVAVLTGWGIDAESAVDAGRALFGDEIVEIPSAAEVRSGGVNDRVAKPINETMPLPPHTDGFVYGDRYPDHFLLACACSSPEGGESIAVDGYAVLDAMQAQPGGEALVERMATAVIDQTEPGMQGSLTPIIGTGPTGRVMLRRFPFQKPAEDSPDPVADAAMIAAWHAAALAAGDAAPRFKLGPGNVAVFDNYRMLHGREPYTDTSRLMWRVWIWTTASYGVPDGRLHSDSRYASAH